MGRMERSRKHNDDAVKSMKVEDGIGNAARGRRIWMTGSWNVEANGESLRSLGVAGGTSAEGAESKGGRVPEETHDEGGRDADHCTAQFLIVRQKHYFVNISRTEARPRARNY
jgi:hypothetical protein